MSSTALKNLTAFVFGLPNGRNLPAVTSKATSSGVQFSSFATCAASSRAGKSFAAQVVIAACVKSPSIKNFPFGAIAENITIDRQPLNFSTAFYEKLRGTGGFANTCESSHHGAEPQRRKYVENLFDGISVIISANGAYYG